MIREMYQQNNTSKEEHGCCECKKPKDTVYENAREKEQMEIEMYIRKRAKDFFDKWKKRYPNCPINFEDIKIEREKNGIVTLSIMYCKGDVYNTTGANMVEKFHIDERNVMEDEIKITDGIKAIIKDVLKAKMPNSKDGRETNITPLEISSHHSSFIFPIKKLFPRFVDFQHCKKIDELLDRENKDIAEFKWLRLKTGLVIVSNRHNEYINIITGNKIDPIYVIEEAVALYYSINIIFRYFFISFN